MKYYPEIKMYYGPIDASTRLVPAPNISISLERNYSNDTIIGYSYIITFNGKITALDLSHLEYGDDITDNGNYNLGAVADHIDKIRKIFAQNGNILNIVHGETNNSILKAKGGILRSFTVSESDNNWVHFANYSATIEFSSVDLTDKVEDCSNIFLDPTTYPIGNAGIVDIQQFKIKSFEDSWSFTFDETESYNRIQNNELATLLNIDNTNFHITYNISATGKHFYVYDDEAANTSKLLPAWEQAKNFVQYRLHSQVTNLIDNVLKNTYTSACNSGDALTDINIPGASNSGLLSNLGDSHYKIYNEEISCDMSESEGSFSATYNAIIKKSDTGSILWTYPSAKHTVKKSVNKSFNGTSATTTINVDGTIEGLIEGGLIRSPTPISLPSQGKILIYNSSENNKYINAKILLDKIYDPNQYAQGKGVSGKRDLAPLFKTALGVTPAALGRQPSPADPRTDPPHPESFNLTHDYNKGVINYSVSYNSNTSCGLKYKEVSIQTTQPTKIIATFNVPNSQSCPIIQELGTFTAPTTNITIQGMDLSDEGKQPNIDLSSKLAILKHCDDPLYLPFELPPPPPSSILTQQQYTSNPIDGSFTLNLAYICSVTGCSI